MIAYMKSNKNLIIVISLSCVTYVLSNGEWSIPVFAWIYPVLFLWLAHFCPFGKVNFIIFAIYAIGFIVRFANVIGMDFWVCAVVAVLVAALNSLPYLFWQKSKRNFQSTITFAAGIVIIEYTICRIYPALGGLSDAYTQYENSLLIQIVTLTGIYGISFIMSWTAAIVIWLWDKRSELHKIKKYVSIYCAVIGLIFLYGIVMLQSIQLVESSVRMAAVTVPVSHLLNELFIKTEKEAQADAKIVFWSELNGAVLKEDEAELLQRASDIAKEQDIYLWFPCW